MNLTVLKYEFSNAVRSRWLYAVSLLLALCTVGFSYLTDDPRKVQLSLINVLTVLIPLVSVLFTTTYWYNTEPFTELLLAQPVSRKLLYWSRASALSGSLSLCIFLGLVIPAYGMGIRESGLIWLFVSSSLLGTIFSFLGALIATTIADRMWGMGLGLAIWVYFSIIHDALLLMVLYWFRDYPLDLFSALICAFNPLGLMRVTLLMFYDAPVLLGHSGALIRHLVEGGSGYFFSGLFLSTWVLIPALIGSRKFKRRDF